MTVSDPASPNGASEDREIQSLLAPYATAVDCTTARRLPLESPRTLWLVTDGALDVFAVADEGDGDWTFLGRLEPGMLMLGSVPEQSHSLFGRPRAGCGLARLKVSDLARIQGEQWAANRHTRGFAAEENVVARGIDRGLGILLDSIRNGRLPRDAVPIG